MTQTATWQDHTSAFLNGLFGDWLEARSNPLSIPMQFLHEGVALDLSAPAVARPEGTLVVLIHGLTELETIFHYPEQPGVHYGTELAQAMPCTPLCLRFNSGRAIYRNGEELADKLEELVANWPVAVDNLILIGHSMGGLMIRSACHYGRHYRLGWTRRVSSCVYIGSPHDGSWFAKGARATAGAMKQMPRDYLRVVGDVIDLRSEGIRNLSRGNTTSNREPEAPLLPGARHYAVYGRLARREDHPINALFGDALVHESSARGDERDGWVLTGQASYPGIDHFSLAHHAPTLEQLREWFA